MSKERERLNNTVRTWILSVSSAGGGLSMIQANDYSGMLKCEHSQLVEKGAEGIINCSYEDSIRACTVMGDGVSCPLVD